MINTINDYYKEYGLSESEIKIIEGYAEGHGLEIKILDDMPKPTDLQSKDDSSWADGMLDIIE